MRGALRVKINNNLQVAVCWRVGWLSLQRQHFSGCIHRGMVWFLSCCCWCLNQRLGITAIWENSSNPPQDTILFCFSFGWTTFHRLPLHFDLFSYPKSNTLFCVKKKPCFKPKDPHPWCEFFFLNECIFFSKVLLWSLFLDDSTGGGHILSNFLNQTDNHIHPTADDWVWVKFFIKKAKQNKKNKKTQTDKMIKHCVAL